MNSTLQKLAAEAGIICEWTDAHGQQAALDEEVLRGVLQALDLPAESDQQIADSLDRVHEEQRQATNGPMIIADAGQPIPLGERLPAGSACRIELEDGTGREFLLAADGQLPPLPCGYHRLLSGERQWTLACAPAACLSVAELSEDGREHLWGLSAQVYSLRRPGDGGLGDTAALEDLLNSAAGYGADALAISPLHAMFSNRSEQYSPYSPSSRLLFNVLHAAPEQILGASAVSRAVDECNLHREMARLEALELIDWPAVAAVRLQLLRQLHANFHDSADSLRADFRHYQEQAEASLQQHCLFEALQSDLLKRGQPADWREWPMELRCPDAPGVAIFANEHQPEIEFHTFCQWLTGSCLDYLQSTARGAGMAIGLIADMAIGADGSGSFGWSRQSELLANVSIGAPPDLLNQNGQNWGVAAFSPNGLKQNGYSAFIDMLRANLAHAGGMRIDHVMGLQRLWIIPHGSSPQDGAYLNYPLQDLLRLLALESWRHRALIIGEDLGTVPEGLRETLAQRHILGMRVLLFEQQDGELPAPEQWPADALATSTTHDLPSLYGWQTGRDIEWREVTGQRDPEQSHRDLEEREQEKQGLLRALREDGLLQEDQSDPLEQLDASIQFIGRTPAPLVLVPLEDVMGTQEQPNLPGTIDEHPNWRRRWPVNASSMLDSAASARRLRQLHEARARRERGAPHD